MQYEYREAELLWLRYDLFCMPIVCFMTWGWCALLSHGGTACANPGLQLSNERCTAVSEEFK
eukprot:5904218-Ditylum_brightwellii.AAC.1